MAERNSERQKTWIGIATGVAVIILTILDQILGWGIIPAEHAATGILAGIVGAVGPIVGYQTGRSKIKAARELAKPGLAAVKANPSTP